MSPGGTLLLIDNYVICIPWRLWNHGLLDYKFYCFHGEPKFLYISEGLGGDHRLAKMNFVDLEWNKTPFQRPDFMDFDVLPQKPEGFEEMIRLSETLSVNGQVFSRS